jgi:NAD(P) transhydrogenase
MATFADSHTIRMLDNTGHRQEVTAENIIIAVGTDTAKDEHIPFDGQRIFTSDDILTLKNLPKSIAVVGAGVIGSEYATIFSILGARVTLIDLRSNLLSFVDSEITDALIYQLRQNRGTMRLGEEVSGIEPFEDERGEHVRINLASGKEIVTEMALYSVGRVGATANLGLENTNITPDARGKVSVNEYYQTEDPKIYAVGDVIGFPSLASTSMEQGRMAARHAFGASTESVQEVFPYGIYTVPEISTVGRNEEELTEAGISYEVGRAFFKEIARGQITGDSTGLLKILFDPDSLKVLGVHILGEGACDLIHIGQAVMALDGTMDYFINTVFNYPTLAECYKTAAFDGINRLG